MTTVTYVSRNAPSFSMRVPLEKGDYKLQFINKHCSLDPEDAVEGQVIKFLDDLIEKRPDISSQINKVDREAALQIAASRST